MSNHDVRVTVNYLQYGQARPYADSIYKARLAVDRFEDGNWVPVKWADSEVKHLTQAVRRWTQEGNPHQKPFGECFAPHLTKFEKVGNGVWEVTVTEVYAD